MKQEKKRKKRKRKGNKGRKEEGRGREAASVHFSPPWLGVGVRLKASDPASASLFSKGDPALSFQKWSALGLDALSSLPPPVNVSASTLSFPTFLQLFQKSCASLLSFKANFLICIHDLIHSCLLQDFPSLIKLSLQLRLFINISSMPDIAKCQRNKDEVDRASKDLVFSGKRHVQIIGCSAMV